MHANGLATRTDADATAVDETDWVAVERHANGTLTDPDDAAAMQTLLDALTGDQVGWPSNRMLAWLVDQPLRHFDAGTTAPTHSDEESFAYCARRALAGINGYRYAEGWATDGTGRRFWHAWLVDDDERTVDPMLGTAGSDYLGVVVDGHILRSIASVYDDEDFEDGVVWILARNGIFLGAHGNAR